MIHVIFLRFVSCSHTFVIAKLLCFQREIILGFLGSSSYSGSGSKGIDEHSGVTDSKKLPPPNEDEKSAYQTHSMKPYFLSTASYIFEGGNGTVYLKAAEEVGKRSPLSPKFLSSVISKKVHTSERFARHCTLLKPGWRALAAKDIPRIKVRTVTYKRSTLPSNLKSRAFASSSSSSNKERWAKSSEVGFPREAAFFQNDTLYFNLFGASADVEVETEDNCAPSKCDNINYEERLAPYLKKCVPSFDSLLRQRNTGWPRRRCILEGWVAFRIGETSDLASNWRDAQRDWLRYIVFHENSNVLFAYDSVGASAASKSIDLSRGRVTEPLQVSRELGHAVVVKSKSVRYVLMRF